MSELTPYQRSLIARIAANSRIAKPGYNGHEATRAATAAKWARYYDTVDPDRTLTEGERDRRAKALWKVDMDKAKLRASRKGSRRKKA